MNNDQNLNVFEYAGSTPEGCSTGVHLLNDDTLMLQPDGDLTALSGTCSRCNAKITVSSPLKLNKYLQPAEPVQPKQMPIYNPPQQINQPQDNGDEVLRKLFGK